MNDLQLIKGALIAVILAACGPLQAATAIPRFTAPVVDTAGVLSGETQAFLNRELNELRRAGGNQIAVLTVPKLEDESIEQYGIRVADAWKPGDAKTDSGVILLIALADRKVRIEVGRGLEGQLTDVYSSRIIREKIEPLFKQGDYDQGVVTGLAYIVHYTDPDYHFGGEGNPPAGHVKHGRRVGGIGLIPMLIIFFIFIVFSVLRGLVFGFGGYRRYGSWGSGGGGFFGGGGDGGGFSGGGGGGFSGGGASGGW